MNYIHWSFANTGATKIAEMRYNIVRLHNKHFHPKYDEYANESLLFLDIFNHHSETLNDPTLVKLFELIVQLEDCEEAYDGELERTFYKAMVDLSHQIQSVLEDYPDAPTDSSEALLEQLERALLYHNISVQKVRTKSIIGFSITHRPFYDVMILEGDIGPTGKSAALYCSEPIDIEGKYLLPFYILAYSLNVSAGIPGCWQFIISNRKGYFCYKYVFGETSTLKSFSDTQLAVHLGSFADYVLAKMHNDLLSIRRFIMMTERDKGLGHSMNFAKALTLNASFEADLPEDERKRLLALQAKYESDPDLVLSSEDEESLVDLYESQLVDIREDRIASEIKMHVHFSNIIRKLDQIAQS